MACVDSRKAGLGSWPPCSCQRLAAPRLFVLFSNVPTPCIGVCSTTFGDTVCRGCRRYLHEIVDWNRYGNDAKRAVWLRLEAVLAQVLPAYFRINDAALLEQHMRELKLDVRNPEAPWSLLFALLRASAAQEPDLAPFGVSRIDRSKRSLLELREHIGAELYQLACAYYEKDHLRAHALAANSQP